MSESPTCSQCGAALTGPAKRYRDKRGKVYCGACAEARSRSKTSTSEPSTSSGYDLADEPPAAGAPRAAARSGPLKDLDVCPGCGGAIIKSDIICIKCGYNRHTGRGVEPAAPGDASGTPAPAPRRVHPRRKTVADDVRREVRAAYIKPVVIIALCLPIALVIWALISGSPSMAMFSLGAFVAMYAATFIGFFACSVIWIGFDEPIGLEALRLGAACAIAEIARATLSPLPGNWRIQIVVQLVIGFVFVVSVMQMMEMDKEDAIIFAILVWFVRLFLYMALLNYATQQGWVT